MTIVKHRSLIDHDECGHYYTGPLHPALALVEQQRTIHHEVKGAKEHVFFTDREGVIREWGISLVTERAWRYALAEFFTDYWDGTADEDGLRFALRSVIAQWSEALL